MTPLEKENALLKTAVRRALEALDDPRANSYKSAKMCALILRGAEKTTLNTETPKVINKNNSAFSQCINCIKELFKTTDMIEEDKICRELMWQGFSKPTISSVLKYLTKRNILSRKICYGLKKETAKWMYCPKQIAWVYRHENF